MRVTVLAGFAFDQRGTALDGDCGRSRRSCWRCGISDQCDCAARLQLRQRRRRAPVRTGICDKVDQGRPYGQLITDLETDFNTADNYQAAYLINQAINELCPISIWQLRNAAAGYVVPPAQ